MNKINKTKRIIRVKHIIFIYIFSSLLYGLVSLFQIIKISAQMKSQLGEPTLYHPGFSIENIILLIITDSILASLIWFRLSFSMILYLSLFPQSIISFLLFMSPSYNDTTGTYTWFLFQNAYLQSVLTISLYTILVPAYIISLLYLAVSCFIFKLQKVHT